MKSPQFENSQELFQYALVIFIIILSSYFLLVENSFLYMLSDVYYYSSLAKSLSETGTLFCLTTFPETPAVTTQNGIVIIHYLLMLLGIEDMTIRLYTIVGINLIFVFFTLYVLRKIFIDIFHLDHFSVSLILIAISLNTKWMISFLQPINDIFFVLLAFLYIYLFLSEKPPESWKKLGFFLIAVLICHFRLQAIFLFLSAIIVLFSYKRYMEASFHAFLLILSFVSVSFLNHFIIDDWSGIDGLLGLIANDLSPVSFIKKIVLFFKSTLPILFFDTDKLSLIYLWVFVGSIFLLLKKSYYEFKKIDDSSIRFKFIFLFILLNIGFVILFPSQTARYLLVVYPFILHFTVYEFMSRFDSKKVLLSYIFILCSLLMFRVLGGGEVLSGSMGIFYGIDYSLNKDNSKKMIEEIGFEYDLIAHTYRGRVSYFLLNEKPTVSYDFLSKENIIYMGPESLFSSVKSKLSNKGIRILEEQKMPYEFNLRHDLSTDSYVWRLKVEHPD